MSNVRPTYLHFLKNKFYAAVAEKLYVVLAPLTPPPLSFHLQVESLWQHKTNLCLIGDLHSNMYLLKTV